jgi:2-phosphosulfolactate phosphatase
VKIKFAAEAFLMKVICIFLPTLIRDRAVAGRICVVFDVLRASTTIVTALGNGAGRIIPVAMPADAQKMKEKLCGSESVVLAGEREGRRITGFDLGNSPTEFTVERIRGKTIIMCTTNGTAAILAAREARLVLIGSFANLGAVARRAGVNEDLILLCAGKEGGISLEDIVACGAFVELMVAEGKGGSGVDLDDGAMIALDAFRASRDDIMGVLRKGNHGRYLESIGFGGDLEVCAQRDVSDIVPYFDATTRAIKVHLAE